MNGKTKLIIVALSFWTFVHAFLLLKNTSNFKYPGVGEVFYPMSHPHGIEIAPPDYFNSYYYDYSEFLVYAVLPWMIFLLYRFVSKKAKD